jgi:hypothetical protein
MKNNLKHFAININPNTFAFMEGHPMNANKPILSGTCDVGSPIECNPFKDGYYSYTIHKGRFIKHIPRTKRHRNRNRIVEQKVF